MNQGKELRKQEFDVICIDEAHHAAARSYVTTLDALRYRKRILLGLTATPTRTQKGGVAKLKEIFGKWIVHQVFYKDLMTKGYLAIPRNKQVETEEAFSLTAKMRRDIDRNKDFSAEFFRKLADRASRNEGIVCEALKHRDQYAPMLLFALNKEHARTMQSLFQREGIATGLILGTTPRKERDELVEALRRDELECIVNVEVLTEGVDIPELAPKPWTVIVA